MNPEPMVGLHVSSAGSLELSFERAKELGATTFQIFTRNPNQWKFSPIPEATVAAFRKKRAESGLARIVDHMPYLPNLASPEKSTMKISRYTLVEELKRCDALGIDYLVVHLGSHLGKGTAVGIANIAGACNEAIEASDGNTVVLLENMAGQKNCVGARFEEIRGILDRVNEPARIGVCLDTCLPPGSRIFSGGAPLPIEDIVVGGEVTGADGLSTRVTRVIRRPYSGDLVWVKPKGLPAFATTPEHPLLCVKVGQTRHMEESPWRAELTGEPTWVSADYVREGTYLVMPRLKSPLASSIDFREYVGADAGRLPFPLAFPLTAELAEFFGLYLNGGSASIGKGRRGESAEVSLGFGKYEKDLIRRAVQLFEKIFSLKAWTCEEGPVVKVCAGSNTLARFLRSNFGPNAPSKRIPSFIMRAPRDIVFSFILAYRKGGGRVDERGVHFATSSSTVSVQLVHLLARVDVHSTVQSHEPTATRIEGGVVGEQGRFTVNVGRAEARKLGFVYHLPTIPQHAILRSGGSFLIPIDAIRRDYYSGDVMNLTTQSGSFLAPFVATHNCHMYAAGFDLGSDEAVAGTMDLFSEIVGMGKLKTVHLNDSKGPLGSRLDRHENIGEGKIGRRGFRALLHYPGINALPLIMETPYGDVSAMRKSIKLVRSLLK